MAAGLLFFLAIGCGLGSIYGYQLEHKSARGVLVADNGYPIERAAVAAELERVWGTWERALGRSVRGQAYVVWRSLPFTHDEKRYAGLAIESVAFVGWDKDLAKTALAHEAGHVILFLAGLDPSEESLRRLSEANGIPY